MLTVRKAREEGEKLPKFQVDQSKCKKCGLCLYMFACPAIYREGNEFKIDENLCTGCGVCAQICPAKAIKVKRR